MRICAAGMSERGPVRAENDDHYALGPYVEQGAATVLTLETDSHTFRHYGLLAAVADGMGGYAGGALASRTVLETLTAAYYSERRTGCTAGELADCLERYLAQTRQVLAQQLTRADFADGGTTLAGVALMPPDALVVFHAGDSRVLRAAAGYVRPLTVDHTPLGPDLASGRISEVEAREMPEAGLLTRALGAEGDTRVELATEHTWAAPTSLLLGTDGFHGAARGIGRAEMQEIMRRDGPPDQTLRTLLAAALHADGSDNATLVVVGISA